MSEFELLDIGVSLAGDFSTLVSFDGTEQVFSLLVYAGHNLSVYSRVEDEIYQKIAQLGWSSQGEGDFLRVEFHMPRSEDSNLINLDPSVIVEDPELLKFEAKASRLQDEIYQILHHELIKPRPKLRLI